MFRSQIAMLKEALGTVAKIEWAIVSILVGMTVIALGSGVNFLPVDLLWKVALFVLLFIGIASTAVRIFYKQHVSLDNTQSELTDFEQPDDTEQSKQDIPAMPEQPPTIGISNGESVDQVLKDIRDRLNADALDRKRAEENEKQAAEEKAKLLADETVYYDERPSLIYFFRRSFWKTLIAWIVASGIIYLSLSAATAGGSQPPIVFILLVLAITTWYSIRCYGEWAWTKRRQKGNLVMVQQASNGWFGLFGRLYKISLLDCGNVVIGKTWYERALRLSSGTVSIETPLDNKKPGESEGKVHDVFKNMRNVRDPERFQELVLKRHDEITFGQPDVIRRSDH